jgi:hypothetical protein
MGIGFHHRRGITEVVEIAEHGDLLAALEQFDGAPGELRLRASCPPADSLGVGKLLFHGRLGFGPG